MFRRWEKGPGFGDFPQLVVNTFNQVCGVHDAVELWREPQERGELFPGLAPYSYHSRVAVTPLVVEFVQLFGGCFGVDRGVHGP